MIMFQLDSNNNNQEPTLAQQIPMKSSDVSDPVNIDYLSTNFEALASISPPPPIPPRISKNLAKFSPE